MTKHFDPEKQLHRELEPRRNTRRPFDDLEIDRLPRPRSDDPPYQDWWVPAPIA